MRRFHLVICFLLCSAILSPAYTQVPACGHDAVRAGMSRHLRQAQDRLDQQLAARLARGAAKSTVAGTIPVVVHVIHQNGNENISQAQIQTGIDQLNAAFANTGVYQDANGVATGISFCLAARDPQGNFSTGVNRVVSPLTQLTIETDDTQLKALSYWNSNDYLNIWVVASISSLSAGAGVAGYATFPAAHGMATDGIVVEAPYLGGSNDDTKVTVHEVGHYLGLYHTFEGGCGNANCLLDGDRVCDTPPDGSSAPNPCGAAPNTCTTDTQDPSSQNPFRPIGMGGLGDQNDPTWDYMDYGYQSCQVRFSQGQADRMLDYLSTTRASLGLSMGCQNPCANPTSAAFTPNVNTVLSVGSSLTFTNGSTGASSYTWQVNGTTFSTAASPSYTFNQTGNYVIQLLTGNGSAACADSASITVEVRCTLLANFTASSTEVKPGDNVTFTQASPGAVSYTWLYDGAQVQTGPSYSHTFSDIGGHTVCLVTFNGTCRDTACTYVPVGDCGRKRNNVWTFGFTGRGLDFNSGSPVLTQSSINGIMEGTAAICNAQGQVQLYSDGSRVYRAIGVQAVGNVLPNGSGLWGGALGSSTQSCLFVPNPEDDSIYYLFTADETAGYYGNTYGGIAYNVIDLRAGTNGDVVLKNQPLFTRAAEKLAAVRHANGCDYWVMGHSFMQDSTDFRAFQVTPGGVNPVPVISSVGFPHTKGLIQPGQTPTVNAQGQMKFSPDGSRIAVVIQDTNVVEIFDFDKSTGKVSNPITYQVPTNSSTYGLEFSPDGSKLYFGITFGFCSVVQLNLNAGSPAAVLASATTVLNLGLTNYPIGSLQLAPDGKIYIAVTNRAYLYTIQNPNALGTACNAVANGPGLGFDASYGLQNNVADFGMPSRPQAHGPLLVCQGSTGRSYYFDQYSCADSVIWDVSPGPVIASNTNGALSVDFPVTGTFTFIVEAFSACGKAKDTLTVTCVPFTQPNLGPDRTLCTGTNITLSPGGGYTTYLWNNGATTPTRSINQPGTYSVTVSNGTCTASDTLVVLPAVPVQPNLGPDASICPGGIRTLTPGPGFTSYQWQDLSANASFTAWQPGTYWVRTTDGCGAIGRDTLVLTADNSFQVSLGPDTVVCQGSSITLDAGAGQGSYLWSTGATTPSISVGTPGVYWVEVVQASGCYDRDTVLVELCVGLSSGPGDLTLQLYPNPAQDDLHARFSRPVYGEVVVRVIDGLGRAVLQQSHLNAGQSSFDIPLTGLAQGLYQVKVAAEGQVYTGKITKR
jgi:hypothetical protein